MIDETVGGGGQGKVTGMKILSLLRHAKASSDDPECTDLDRPLNTRGRGDASWMADALREQSVQGMLSSPAKRARSTARVFSKALRCDCTFEERLYGAGPGDLLAITNALDEGWQHAVIVGHNPGLEEFASLLLGGKQYLTLPTCSWLSLALSVHAWRDVGPGVGRNVLLLTPKKLRHKAGRGGGNRPLEEDG